MYLLILLRCLGHRFGLGLLRMVGTTRTPRLLMASRVCIIVPAGEKFAAHGRLVVSLVIRFEVYFRQGTRQVQIFIRCIHLV